MEPTTTVASGFALSKVYLALPALFMSLVAYFLRKSKSPELAGHGRMATGIMVLIGYYSFIYRKKDAP
jgi:hypothetical protein